MRVGVDLRDAEAAEVHFGFSEQDIGQAERLVVRFSRDQVVMGRQSGMDEELTPLSKPIKSPPPGDPETPMYHEIRVEMHGDDWFAFFDDSLLGTTKGSSTAFNRVVQLVTRGGNVNFEGPNTFGLRPK